jgi:hypothetical protein
MVMRAKELQIEIERRMDVQTLDDDSLFSNSDVDENENNDENNSNSNHGNNSNNNDSNNNNEIITSADYSDWDDEEDVVRHESGNVGHFGSREENWNDASEHSDSDRGKNMQLRTSLW